MKTKNKSITLTPWEKQMILSSLSSIMVLNREENQAYNALLEKIKNA